MTKRKILWIGGSSQLARCYCSNYGSVDENDKIFLCGVEPECPFPLVSNNISYFAQDLTELAEKKSLSSSTREVLAEGITSVVVSIRPVLVTALSNDAAWEYNQKILHGLQVLLQAAIDVGSVRQVIHISSVAAANHLQAQINHDEEADGDDSHLWNVSQEDRKLAPYDRFKLRSEALIAQICTSSSSSSSSISNNNAEKTAPSSSPSSNKKNRILYTNLRISGILFEEGRCIVTQSFDLQARLGVYIPVKIDVNPARNVASAIRLVFSKTDKIRLEEQSATSSVKDSDSPSLHSIYYYTRPTLTKDPITLADVSVLYQNVCGLQWWQCFWTPFCLYVAFIYFLYYLGVVLGSIVPYIHATDYLLRVGLLEHSFNNARFQKDFPEIRRMEVSVEECFRKRLRYLKKKDL